MGSKRTQFENPSENPLKQGNRPFMEPTLKLVASGRADEFIAGLHWCADSSALLISPGEGRFLLMAPGQEKPTNSWQGFGFGNGAGCFLEENRVALPSHDGKLRVYRTDIAEPECTLELGRGLVEKAAISAGGGFLAAACGKSLHIFETRSFASICKLPAPKSGICDFAWHPADPERIVIVGDGGACLHKIPSPEPYARFDWGGASLRVLWSPDSRWVITADQTPSVHLYDCPRDFPLHIQGYAAKVKGLALSPCSRLLATGCMGTITLWGCAGPKGPEGSVPTQIPAHHGECEVLAWSPSGDLLASGGTDGALLLFNGEEPARPIAIAESKEPITSLAWSPDSRLLAIGGGKGAYFVFRVIR
jgi:WD40 repeat protein